ISYCSLQSTKKPKLPWEILVGVPSIMLSRVAQVALGLWLISYVGSFFTFLILLCIASETLFSLYVPLLYEKYRNQIDDKLITAQKVIQKHYRIIDENVLRKILKSSNKEKKTQ
ncbi:reticulon-like protein b10, partial [Nicotiana attenuata]